MSDQCVIIELLNNLEVKMDKHTSLCDEWSEWVSCPVCDEHTVCAYCVEYLLDGTFTDCSEIN